MSDGVMTYEDWLRGCVHHDGRNGYVTLPCDEVLKIADFIERLRKSNADNAFQDVESVESVGSVDRKTEPQTDDKKCTYAYDKYGEEWYPIYAKRKEDEPQSNCEGCDRYEDGGELCDMCALEKGKEDAQTEGESDGKED